MNDPIDLRQWLDVVIRRWQIVVAMPIIAIIAFAGATLFIKPTYEATATIALAPSTVSISLANQLPPYYLMVDSPHHLPIAYTPTYYIAVLKGADVVAAAKPQAAITISPDGNDRSLIAITARANDATQAADSANAYAQAGAERIAQIISPPGDEVTTAKKRLDAAQDAYDKFLETNRITDYDPTAPPSLSPDKRKELSQLSRDRDLAESVYLVFAREFAQSSILAETTLRPTVIAAPIPTSPNAPKLAQNALIGAGFGLFIGIVGAFALDLVLKEKSKPPSSLR
jgi:capsular polysaccharide biosynthesis protein